MSGHWLDCPNCGTRSNAFVGTGHVTVDTLLLSCRGCGETWLIENYDGPVETPDDLERDYGFACAVALLGFFAGVLAVLLGSLLLVFG